METCGRERQRADNASGHVSRLLSIVPVTLEAGRARARPEVRTKPADPRRTMLRAIERTITMSDTAKTDKRRVYIFDTTLQGRRAVPGREPQQHRETGSRAGARRPRRRRHRGGVPHHEPGGLRGGKRHSGRDEARRGSRARPVRREGHHDGRQGGRKGRPSAHTRLPRDKRHPSAVQAPQGQVRDRPPRHRRRQAREVPGRRYRVFARGRVADRAGLSEGSGRGRHRRRRHDRQHPRHRRLRHAPAVRGAHQPTSRERSPT